MLSWSLIVFFPLGVFLISVKTLTTEITENKTTPKICKITVLWHVIVHKCKKAVFACLATDVK